MSVRDSELKKINDGLLKSPHLVIVTWFLLCIVALALVLFQQTSDDTIRPFLVLISIMACVGGYIGMVGFLKRMIARSEGVAIQRAIEVMNKR